MSDYDDDFDAFAVDESFLRAVEDIEARAVSIAPTRLTSVSSAAAAPSTASHRPLGHSGASNQPPRAFSRADPNAGPSRRAAALGVRLPRPPAPHPSSDDFGDMSFTAESLEQIDAATRKPPSPNRHLIPSSGIARTLQRTTSGRGSKASAGWGRTPSGQILLQTHLGFRREPQYTKGKRWDRTAFAQSGRRVSADKNKKKGKGRVRDEEDDEEEEDDWGEPLAPDPKPLVDTSKSYGPQRHNYSSSTVKDYLYPINHPKRDYQYDIIRSCFTDNCLVALPTGLGKTFIAGVVMLNFYRWFPTGKIVFLAPTRPLVNQQIEACQLTCGIPSADAAVMTGANVSAKEREKLWDERRVFYCTPQTLDNDLKRGAVDPQDIVLAVFDEAHKASGSYAYTTILAYITAHHPYFRVLALTATPGGDVPKVQGVVDALHISRIEIREAEAPEIRKYMNEKRTEKHIVRMSQVIEELRDRWAALMRPYIQKLVERNILTERDLDAKRLRPFRLTAKRMELGRDRSSGMGWAFGPLNNLEKMARAMLNLLEFSLGMFHTTILEIAGSATKDGKKGNSRAAAGSIRNNIEFQRLLGDVEGELRDIDLGRDGKTKADKHPKMHKALELLLEYFAQAEEDEKVHGVKNDTRAMVFCSYRDCVLDVVDMLNEHPGLLRATKFVGQSQGKQERDKGFNQKEQKRTINEFKEGKFNILVATSIGEEGLDIGEVDFVVIYDMPKQSIKLLQRIGRTGRKRDGYVHVLMSEDREDSNWDTAQRTHRDIQEEILHSRNLELFEDVERLLPPGPLPTCVEDMMDVDPWDPADQKKKRTLAAASEKAKPKAPPAKRKRGFEIPDDAPTGFKSVAELLREQKTKGKKRVRANSDEEEEEEVEEEEELEEGDEELLHGKVTSGRVGPKPKKKTASGRGAKKPKASKPATKTKANSSAKSKSSSKSSAASTRRATTPPEEDSEKEAEQRSLTLNRMAMDFFNTEGIVRERTPEPLFFGASSQPSSSMKSSPLRSPPMKVSALGDSELSPSKSLIDSPVCTRPPSNKLTPRTAAAAGFSQVIDLSWEDDDDDDMAIAAAPASPSPPPAPEPRRLGLSRPLRPSGRASAAASMPPPLVPSSPRRTCAFDTPSRPPQSPLTATIEPTPFPVRHRGRRIAVPATSEDSPATPAPLQRLRRRRDPDSPAGPAVRRPRPNVAELMDLDAGVSGSESSDESSGTESESDRRFAGDFAATQAPKGYNQHAMYAAGLSTQAGARAGLAFGTSGVDRRTAFLAKARQAVLVSDDERSSDNEYELGSFVCDDGDVAFMSQSDPLGSGL